MKNTLFKIRNHATMGATLAALTIAMGTPAFAQSQRAYERANCNASFQNCSGGGSGAPIGDLGASFLELAAIGLIFLALTFVYMRRNRSKA